MTDSRPRRLARAGLGLGVAALVVFALGLLWGAELGLMGIGLIFLGLGLGALLGAAGLVVSGMAIARAEAGRDKGLAIAGLVVCLIPVVILLWVTLELRRERGDVPELPLEPPPPELLEPATEG